MAVSEQQRQAIVAMLADRVDRRSIAEALGVTPGQVSAIAAHITMGTYGNTVVSQETDQDCSPNPLPSDVVQVNNPDLSQRVDNDSFAGKGMLIGHNVNKGDAVFWDPFPQTGSANPHVLIFGESGFGKTYVVQCLLMELATVGIPSIVFDYGQGFVRESLPAEFVRTTKPTEIQASRDGIAINPLQIFPSDLHGPVSVAQRVADTFTRVYPRIGIQQHAVLRQAVLDLFADHGFVNDDTGTLNKPLPLFNDLQRVLLNAGSDPQNALARVATSASAHISTLFVFNTFRPAGRKLNWPNMLDSKGQTFIIQLKALEYSLERAVTEFLLWNLIGYIESLGPSGLRLFIVLDEAHKLSFERGSPVERLLREGRKYGVGLILASQQPSDFPPVAFSNTSTKLAFQVADDRAVVSRQLFQKAQNVDSYGQIHRTISQLPPGVAYVVSQNIGQVVNITPMHKRGTRSGCSIT